MTQSFYLINERKYTTPTGINNELVFQDQKNYLFDLDYLSVIDVLGDNAMTFLQGQLTCDVNEVTSEIIRQGALCNLKGRIQALLDVIKPQNYQLIIAADLVEDTIASLSKVAMLSRVKLQLNSTYKVYGFYLKNPDDLLPVNIEFPQEKYGFTISNDCVCYCIDDNLFIIISPTNFEHSSCSWSTPFVQAQRLRGSLAWHYLQVLRKQMQIYPSTRGLFLPHRLNLHLSPYISFSKGCYKGQEIITRTHYRAKLKHSLEIFKIHTIEPISAGKKLLDPVNHREVGELIDFCPSSSNNEIILIASVLQERPENIIIQGHQGQDYPILI